MQNNTKIERAKLFAPFDSLKGLFEKINEKERIIVDKKDLCLDALDELERRFKLSKRRSLLIKLSK